MAKKRRMPKAPGGDSSRQECQVPKPNETTHPNCRRALL